MLGRGWSAYGLPQSVQQFAAWKERVGLAWFPGTANDRSVKAELFMYS